MQVSALREELGDRLTVVTNYPESVEARYIYTFRYLTQSRVYVDFFVACRTAFDKTAEKLCEKLCEIDRWVADAVVDQVTEVFVEPSAPVNHLVQAAAGSATTISPRVSGCRNTF